jgi:hypothetical protein
VAVDEMARRLAVTQLLAGSIPAGHPRAILQARGRGIGAASKAASSQFDSGRACQDVRAGVVQFGSIAGSHPADTGSSPVARTKGFVVCWASEALRIAVGCCSKPRVVVQAGGCSGHRRVGDENNFVPGPLDEAAGLRSRRGRFDSVTGHHRIERWWPRG